MSLRTTTPASGAGSDLAPDAWNSLFVAEADGAAALAVRLSRRQVHTVRTPNAADVQAPIRVSRREGAARRLTTQGWPLRMISMTIQPSAGRSRRAGGFAEPRI
jgi:hypothetical protein